MAPIIAVILRKLFQERLGGRKRKGSPGAACPTCMTFRQIGKEPYSGHEQPDPRKRYDRTTLSIPSRQDVGAGIKHLPLPNAAKKWVKRLSQALWETIPVGM